MGRFRGKRKHPKLLQRLFWRWIVISTFLCTRSVNCEQSIASKSSQHSLPTNNVSDFPLHQSDSDTASTEDYNTSSSSTGRPNESVLQSVLPPVQFNMVRGSDALSHTDFSERVAESNSPVSCYGRCGDRKSFPCSCTDICMVNGNCCHDMKTQCPSLFNSGLSRFNHLLEAEVQCSNKTSTFMIMSCPGPSSSRENKFLEEETVTKDGVELVTQPKNSEIFTLKDNEKKGLFSSALTTFILDSPVTDTTTGLVYRNQSVARCNGVLDLDTVPWLVQVAINSDVGNPDVLSDLKDMISTDIVVYLLPDSSKVTSMGNKCIRESKRQCRKAFQTDRPDLESRCLNGSITYYKTDEYEYFDNIDCAICNLGAKNQSSPVTLYTPVDRNFRLSLVASLTSSGTLTLRAASGKSRLSWATIECFVSAGESCSKSKCSEKFQDRPDGECRSLKKFVLAFGGRECSYMRSKETERRLLSVLKCYLETFENAEFVSETIISDTVFDERMNRFLVRTSALVYFPTFYVNRNTERILSELLLLIHDANFCCGPHPALPVCKSSSCRLGDLEVPSIQTYKIGIGLYPDPSEHVNSWETAGNGTMIVCGRIDRVDGSESEGPLACLQGPVYEQQMPFFQRAANASCFWQNVGKHAIQEKRHRLCNTCGRNLSRMWFILPLFVKLTIDRKK
ncbi:hypothetical protein ElyMa_001510100 [Elysia marginata]|uniref:SMB domain-containing protein n=1 Tax=Elysia marginata TaxID=1093978 RepID=A0AAV4J7P1_9GAST|nr:hypothetical protein ElyMa_001510100 [Elysia marginata]